MVREGTWAEEHPRSQSGAWSRVQRDRRTTTSWVKGGAPSHMLGSAEPCQGASDWLTWSAARGGGRGGVEGALGQVRCQAPLAGMASVSLPSRLGADYLRHLSPHAGGGASAIGAGGAKGRRRMQAGRPVAEAEDQTGRRSGRQLGQSSYHPPLTHSPLR
ncbi:hypothetical protein BCV69DRAFT_110030 [Microstroma glucosiphilum]|uniref:Uncharacterized protein n=1 Tax=Pseudomicrostroma glucosiphilum TaxID=1684307 RepID=A0A316UFE5_9BASI|nr:hypothetical protein BCV69DRAFT_110030 [Pseudomicrostroma glucosiphilum]PWN23131.1 hypothetical protein BCV69DRAFT_110030 [Pseudomicrostroma glucosiphilum]